jgi:hypothetical protein
LQSISAVVALLKQADLESDWVSEDEFLRVLDGEENLI